MVESALSIIPDALVGSVKILIWILQTLGILVIGYMVYLFISIFLERKRVKEIRQIAKDVSEIKSILRKKK